MLQRRVVRGGAHRVRPRGQLRAARPLLGAPRPLPAGRRGRPQGELDPDVEGRVLRMCVVVVVIGDVLFADLRCG